MAGKRGAKYIQPSKIPAPLEVANFGAASIGEQCQALFAWSNEGWKTSALPPPYRPEYEAMTMLKQRGIVKKERI
ncbi:hypothetical protein JEG43_07110 [Anoxybacillus sp. LAT_35]|uniref:hypothetical protein n=1 Tax=unclassified Anoxybacillus TaxID=2639704 RepID=UPI001EEA5709|nr:MULTISPECIES: hypothetical protein [unclassified Anoxybacillus]MCG3083935.1 hypothetical protein [Anoxybacillus sp. LAT27]MCG5025568.1 hypothetical protein [Anoxybacillus flavithermus]MCG6181493.1 hypothetical protein [Anoxybacillus sp. LAT_33]MCG6196533.1 hypothetical protein [Anoxybacillus sp. LAT_38]MCG6172283.1 hypothetical protein [Anoxybacillus sp. LAT_11]